MHLSVFLESLDVFLFSNQRVEEGLVSLIDQSFTNDLNLVLNRHVFESDISDHDLVYCDVAIFKPKDTLIP